MTTNRSAHAAHARFLSVEEGFNIARPPLEPISFGQAGERAVDPAQPSGFILLDQSHVLQTPFPATTPLLLAKFLRIRPGDCVPTSAKASGEIYCVVRGVGCTRWGNERLDWRAGDVFCLPGGIALSHRAAPGEDGVLFVVTDEPALAFSHLVAAAPGAAPIVPVHYPAELLAEQVSALCKREMGPGAAGRALFLTSSAMARQRTCLPWLTLTLNVVLPGERQRPHKHNAAAIVFVMQEGSVRSRIAGREFPWHRNAVLITPPNAVHAHENDGSEPAIALIVQDGGLHYHCRTMGFEFAGQG
jgi:gentisate 1,2-dioxygenase